MNRRIKHLSLGLVSLSLAGGCAAMQGNAQKKSQKLARTDTHIIQGVPDAVGLGKVAADLKCDRGLFVVDVLKDYVAGAREGHLLEVFGAGVVTSEPVKDFNPYRYLNYLPKGKDEKVDDSKVVRYANAIPVEFGAEPVDSSAYAGEAVAERSSMRMMMGNISETEEQMEDPLQVAKFIPHTAYFAHRNQKDKAFHISGAQGPHVVPRPHDIVHAVRGKNEYGIADLRSFSLEINGKFLAVTIPTDLEMDDTFVKGLSGTIGQPLSVKVNPRPMPPMPVKANFITVSIDDRDDIKAKIPKWRAIYRVADKGQGEIKIPTSWTNGGMKPGTVGVEMTRSFVYAFPFPDDKKGTLCVQAGAGIRTTGTLAEAPKEDAKK